MVRAQRVDACRNRDRLLEVASEAFTARGVEASLEGIAKDAGVGIGTLYRHYPSRDALVEAVYRHNVDLLCDQARELSETSPPEEALREWLQRWVTYVAGKKGLATYLKSVVAADSDLFETTHAKVRATIDQLIDNAVASGSIRAAEGMGLLRAISGVCMMSTPEEGPAQGLALADLLMDGLRYRAASS